MSLPHPSTPGSFHLSRAQRDAMEPALLALASQSGGDLRRLLYAFFGFLHRRTDFYVIPNERDLQDGVPVKMGFREGDAEKLLLAAYRQFPLRRMPRQQQPPPPTRQQQQQPVVTKAEDGNTTNTDAATTTAADTTAGKNPSEHKDGVATSDGDTKTAAKKQEHPPEEQVRRTEEGKQIPVGNGGTTSRYVWTQSLEETSVVLKVPPGTRGKDLAVSLKASSVSVKLKTADTSLLEGALARRIRTDESTWSLEGTALLLTLDKSDKSCWWDTVVEGDDAIDTTLVDSTRKISDYDAATQGYIRKILFDQRQERLGLPSSDNILLDKDSSKSKKSWPKGVEYIDQDKMDDIYSNDKKK